MTLLSWRYCSKGAPYVQLELERSGVMMAGLKTSALTGILLAPVLMLLLNSTVLHTYNEAARCSGVTAEACEFFRSARSSPHSFWENAAQCTAALGTDRCEGVLTRPLCCLQFFEGATSITVTKKLRQPAAHPPRPLCKSAAELLPGRYRELELGETTDVNHGRMEGAIDPAVHGDGTVGSLKGVDYGAGSAHTQRWEADRCDGLRVFNNSDAARCYAQQKVIVLSDSLVRGAFYEVETLNPYLTVTNYVKEPGTPAARAHHLGHLIEATFTPNATAFSAAGERPPDAAASGYLRYVRTRSVNDGVRNEIMDSPSYFLDDTQRLAEADVIVYANGMWDMGRWSCGVEAYYQGVKRQLAVIKEHMKPGARVAVWPLPWLAFDSPRSSPGFLKHNSVAKIVAYREAAELAAGCLGIPTVDSVSLARAMTAFTRDGPHYYHDYQYVARDLFMNMFCAPPAERLAATPPRTCSAEIEAAAVKKWVSGAAEGPFGNKCKAPYGEWERHRHEVDVEAQPEKERATCPTMADVLDGALATVAVPEAAGTHGELQQLVWRPKGCALRPQTTAATVKCLSGQKTAVLGSKALRRLWEYEGIPSMTVPQPREVEFELRASGVPVLQWMNVEAWNNQWNQPHEFATWAGVVERHGAYLAEADVVVVEGGYGDVGAASCGVGAFYAGLKEAFAAIKARAKAGARVLAWAPGAFHFGEYADASYADCYSPEKASALHEAFVLAAACAGVDTIDAGALTRDAAAFTRERGHTYGPAVHAVYNDVLVSTLCHGLAAPPAPCADGAEAAALERWAGLAEANLPCRHHRPERQQHFCSAQP